MHLIRRTHWKVLHGWDQALRDQLSVRGRRFSSQQFGFHSGQLGLKGSWGADGVKRVRKGKSTQLRPVISDYNPRPQDILEAQSFSPAWGTGGQGRPCPGAPHSAGLDRPAKGQCPCERHRVQGSPGLCLTSGDTR